jgi:hypothetical protein
LFGSATGFVPTVYYFDVQYLERPQDRKESRRGLPKVCEMLVGRQSCGSLITIVGSK